MEKTIQGLYMATVEKAEYIQQQGYQWVSVWEWESRRELSCNEERNCYFNNYEVVDSLEPRQSFFGGEPVL